MLSGLEPSPVDAFRPLAEQTFVRELGIVVVAAAVVMLLARRISIPAIVAYLFTGLLLGPVTGFLTTQTQGGRAGHATLHVIAEVGIALLLFLVGLELSIAKIKDVGRVALVAGIGQVVFTALFGFLLGLLLAFEPMTSLFIAVALTFSSTVVVVKLLDQKKELYSLYGRIAVGIFLVQDLVVIVVLTILTGLGDPETLTAARLSVSLGKAFLGMVAMLTVMLVASRYVLPRPFAWVAQSSEAVLIWSLSWCFLAVVAAHALGLSPEIGAFVAGMSLAQLGVSHDLVRRLHPLMSFFVAVFFVALGAQMELSGALLHWKAGVVLSLFVLVGNPFIFMLILTRMGYSERTSFLTSVTVAQISEFSFVFAAVGLTAGLIDASILSLIAVVGVVTIGASSYMILYNHGLYEHVRRMGLLRLFRAGTHQDEEPSPPRQDHVIVVGMNSLGRRIVETLHAAGERTLAVDTDPKKLATVPGETLQGSIDHQSVVEESGLSRAKLAVSALRIEDSNNLLAYRAAQLGIPTAIHAFERGVGDLLSELGTKFVIDSRTAGLEQLYELLASPSRAAESAPERGQGDT